MNGVGGLLDQLDAVSSATLRSLGLHVRSVRNTMLDPDRVDSMYIFEVSHDF